MHRNPSNSCCHPQFLVCTPGLLLMEFWLQYAQALDALSQLQHHVHLLHGLTLQSKKHPAPTKRTRTRSHSVFEGVQARICQISACYHDALTALCCLHPSGGWIQFFQELKKEDIHRPGCEINKTSELQFIPSWIWRVQLPPNPPDLPGSSLFLPPPPTISPDQTLPSPLPPPPGDTPMYNSEVSQEELESYMMVGWAKALKHAKCFEEEVELSVEEMQRTLLFFLWRAAEWT